MIVIITGPTGVGKTALSIDVAQYFNTEIISGDAMQIYQTMDIGTAKITEEEAKQVPHHMIDILDPSEAYSVARYQADVRCLIESFKSRDKLPLIVGGTGFYIKSVVHDFNFDQAYRDDTVEKAYEHLSNDTLYQTLQAVDQATANNVHPNNRKRVIQALNRVDQGAPRSQQINQEKVVYPYVLIVLTMDRQTLYDRINARVSQMFDNGLLEEAKQLYDRGDVSKTASQAIGYKECFAYFDGVLSLDDAKSLIKQRSRQYAKRQLTYFKHQFKKSHVLDVTDMSAQDKVTTVIDIIKKAQNKTS